MLAWMLRGVLLALAAGSALGATAAWRAGLGWPLVCAAALPAPLLPAIALGLEFLLLARFGSDPGTDGPSAPALWRAWFAEWRASSVVFGWRQAFAAGAQPDVIGPPGRRGVVLVHGYVCNRGLWTNWLARLHSARVPACALTLEPVFGSIDTLTDALDEAVAAMAGRTGRAPLVVAHSMGGLVVRAWLRSRAADDRVAGVITIGTPHAGTWLARFALTPNGRQMRLHGHWLAALAAAEPGTRRARFTCYWSDCDNIVFPPAAARWPGADNRPLPGTPHLAMVEHPAVFAEAMRRVGE